MFQSWLYIFTHLIDRIEFELTSPALCCSWVNSISWLTWLTVLSLSWPARRSAAPELTLYLDSPGWPYWVRVDQPSALLLLSWLYILTHLIDRIEFELTSPALCFFRVDCRTHLIDRIEFELTSPAACCFRVDSISWLTWLTVLSLSWPAQRSAVLELTLYLDSPDWPYWVWVD